MIAKDELRVKQLRFEAQRQADQSYYRKLEKLRQKFISKFPPSRIPHLSLDEYVEGKINKNGETNRNTFCYWVEWETIELGRIQTPRGAFQFGVFCDKKTQLYKFTEKFKNENEAIVFQREQIARLLEAGRINNLEEIRKVEISPMFKGKILFLYYPEKYLNIFSEEHIDHFLRKTGLAVPDKDPDVLVKREVLHSFKSNDEFMRSWTTQEFMRFLYDAWRPLPKLSKIPEPLRKYVDTESDLQNSAIDDIPSEPIGLVMPNKIPTAGFRYQRDEEVRRFVIEQAKGACEYCHELGFLLPDGRRYLEAHHIIALAQQGPDTINNVIALCPSDHREAHYGKKAIAMENEMIEIIKNRKV